MRIVTCKEWEQEKKRFMINHNYDCQIETSPMDKNGKYIKTYSFADGALWTEIMRPVVEVVDVEVKKVTMKVKVKLQEIEYFNTDTGISSYYYEKY